MKSKFYSFKGKFFTVFFNKSSKNDFKQLLFSFSCDIIVMLSRCDGMADVIDSKSVVGNHVWVRLPPTAPKKFVSFWYELFFCCRSKYHRSFARKSSKKVYIINHSLFSSQWWHAIPSKYIYGPILIIFSLIFLKAIFNSFLHFYIIFWKCSSFLYSLLIAELLQVQFFQNLVRGFIATRFTHNRINSAIWTNRSVFFVNPIFNFRSFEDCQAWVTAANFILF